jgi:hypothetical protein
VNISPHSLDDMSRQDSKCHRGHQVVAMKLDRAVAATCGSLSLLHPKLIHRQVSFSSNAYWCSRADICAWRFLLPTYTHQFPEMPPGWKSTKIPSVLRDCSNTRGLTVVRRVTTSMEYKFQSFFTKASLQHSLARYRALQSVTARYPRQLATALTEVHSSSHSRLIHPHLPLLISPLWCLRSVTFSIMSGEAMGFYQHAGNTSDKPKEPKNPTLLDRIDEQNKTQTPLIVVPEGIPDDELVTIQKSIEREPARHVRLTALLTKPRCCWPGFIRRW